MKKIFEVILGIYFFAVVYLGLFLINVYTAYCVYYEFGFFLGLISFFSPIISTIIMMIVYTIFYGIFNIFNIVIVIYLLLYIPLGLLLWIVDKLEEREMRKI